METQRIYAMSFADVYPCYIKKAEKKGRKKQEVDEVIRWLTGYTQKQFEAQLKSRVDMKTFFAKAPKLNPLRKLITGLICGVRIEEITDPLMREIRYLDKMIDELAKGRSMEKILRTKNAREFVTKISGGTVHRIPADLHKAISSDRKVLALWEGLTPLARNEWICWVTFVKQTATRNEHIDRLIADLKKGKRRPCCWIGCIHRTDKKISPSIQGILAKRSTAKQKKV